MAAFLFALTVFCWGFSWYAIVLQLADGVPLEVSVFYRFALAAAVLWIGLAATGRLRPARWAQHRLFAAMGLCLFCVNYLLTYYATTYIPSGVVSVLFTTVTLFNVFYKWVLDGVRPGPRVLLGAVLGTAGLACLFAHDVARLGVDAASLIGIGLMLVASAIFGFGNTLSVRATATGIDLPNAVARGMSWGAVYLALVVLVQGHGFAVEPTVRWVGSLLYLSILGSVVAFLSYLSVVARVGADRAAYATVCFPLVALVVSTFLEGYEWTPLGALGLAMILIGNVAIFARVPGRSPMRAGG